MNKKHPVEFILLYSRRLPPKEEVTRLERNIEISYLNEYDLYNLVFSNDIPEEFAPDGRDFNVRVEFLFMRIMFRHVDYGDYKPGLTYGRLPIYADMNDITLNPLREDYMYYKRCGVEVDGVPDLVRKRNVTIYILDSHNPFEYHVRIVEDVPVTYSDRMRYRIELTYCSPHIYHKYDDVVFYDLPSKKAFVISPEPNPESAAIFKESGKFDVYKNFVLSSSYRLN